MAVIINEIIPQQSFEIVLNKIGVILFEELTNQKALVPANDDFEVYVERLVPYDNSENVMINVSLSNINQSGLNLNDSQGQNTFFIDVYAGGMESASETGSENVKKKLHKYVGMVRYILSSGKYPLLGFSPGIIGGRALEQIQFQDNLSNMEASYIRFARLTFTVRVQENQKMADSLLMGGNDTTTKLELTDKGYKLTQNN